MKTILLMASLFLIIFVIALPLVIIRSDGSYTIELNSSQWQCTKSHTEFIGMAVANVCDRYDRKN